MTSLKAAFVVVAIFNIASVISVNNMGNEIVARATACLHLIMKMGKKLQI
jgi:hypothetical protein